MKDLIRQILREETSGFTNGQIKAGYALMNMITKGYHWYYDTPEQPFEYSEGSIWLINPDTKEWLLELKNSGYLRYYDKTYDTFYKYLNMGESDFKSFIKIWVKDALKREVVLTAKHSSTRASMKDVLKNGKQLK